MGSSYFLPKLIGSAVAAELMYTGRMISAEEALRIGLVSRVVERDQLLETALELAQEMVTSATPFGLRITKEVFELAQSGMSLEAVVHIENRNQVLAGQTKDASTARQSWQSEQKPPYTDE
jgi:enoyl-CoA hydratase